MSKLAAFLSSNKIKQADFAQIVGASQPTISRLMAGTVMPSLALAVAIERETGGVIKPSDWLVTVQPLQEAS